MFYTLQCETYYETIYETSYKKECKKHYKKECYEHGYGYHKDYKCHEVPVEQCHSVPVKVNFQVKLQLHWITGHDKYFLSEFGWMFKVKF